MIDEFTKWLIVGRWIDASYKKGWNIVVGND